MDRLIDIGVCLQNKDMMYTVVRKPNKSLHPKCVKKIKPKITDS
jgi:hypothetical protein